MMEYDIHTILDFLTLFATLWVIYTLRFPLKSSYQDEQDSVQSYYVVSNPFVTSHVMGCMLSLYTRVLTRFGNQKSHLLRQDCIRLTCCLD